VTGPAEEEQVPGPRPGDPQDDLLRPREVAELFGVRTTTIARWAREGRITPLVTPGGHRRYRRAALRGLLDDSGAEEAERAFAGDAVRLYEQGWSVRQVADRFGVTYGTMRRVLLSRTTLRPRGGGGRA
jgi:excisionase family DNA binding protein